MEIKVGKEYKCGNRKVKIVADAKNSNGNTAFFCMVGGDKGNVSLLNGFGAFYSDGEYSCNNPNELMYNLEEIEEAKEMTVKEISDELGYAVKVVKESGLGYRAKIYP
jgi:hypothetical protein